MNRLLLCTDLDRTLIPNGAQPESPGAREHFARLAAHESVTLAYVTGRHRSLVEAAILEYALPVPDFVIADVGTTIYRVGTTHAWVPQAHWSRAIDADWGGHDHEDLQLILAGVDGLRLQDPTRQGRHKLSYDLPRESDTAVLGALIRARLSGSAIRARLVWSEDEAAGVGLLDVLPASASKHHAIEALRAGFGLDTEDCVFCGDSGNDLEVLASGIPSVLVANASAAVCEQAIALADAAGNGATLYIARGGFHGMNGCYAAGMLEGIAHFHPHVLAWMGLGPETERA
jgi:sucrose-6F-phosphate phosphohydrolase